MTDIYERALPFTLERSEGGDGLTLEGYAAVFNTPTRIADHLGEYDEVIAPGAFKRTIAKTPVLMFDHGKHPLYGPMPIGSIQELSEDAAGLFVRARLFDTWLNEPLRHAIGEQAIEGMSFRFSVPEGKESWQKRDGDVNLRTIREVKLYELGPVVFPAYPTTSVALRSLRDHFPDEFSASDGIEEDTALTGTPDGPADRSTPDGLATTPEPPAPQVKHLDAADRAVLARQIRLARMGVRKGPNQ